MHRTLLSLVIALVAGCGGNVGPAPDEIAFTTPIHVTTSGAVTPSSGVRFDVRGGVGDQHGVLSVAIQRFDFALAVGAERATLEQLDVVLGDMNVPSTAMPPVGLPLRDLSLGVVPPVRLEIIERNTDLVALRASLPLELAWELELPDGTHYPLGPARTQPLPVDVVVARDAAGDEAATIEIGWKGVVWELPGIVTVRDLFAHAEVPVTVVP